MEVMTQKGVSSPSRTGATWPAPKGKEQWVERRTVEAKADERCGSIVAQTPPAALTLLTLSVNFKCLESHRYATTDATAAPRRART